MIPVVDVSQYQGAWVDRGEVADMIKIGGGDNGIYFDPDAAANYTDAKAHGKGVGGYWFIGWTIGALQEASAFLRGMSPLAENDVYALDIEAIESADPVSYVATMVNYIHGKIGVWPLLYMNLSTLNAYNWDSLLTNCGLWLADWAVSPQANIPTTHAYVMQQYSDGPNYDHDEFFGTLAEFNAYGYHAPTAPVTVSTAQPVQTTTTPVEPVTVTPTQSTQPLPHLTNNVPTIIDPPASTQTPPKTNTPPSTDSASTLNQNSTSPKVSTSWWARLIAWFTKWFIK